LVIEISYETTLKQTIYFEYI